jgi:hypothetical protein
MIDGLSARTIREILYVERAHLWPGAVTRAFAEWRRTVHQPAARILQDVHNAGCPCCDPLEHRDVLAQALKALGTQARRELQSKVSMLDDAFQRRTHHDPSASADVPWWRRRT